MHEDPIPVVNGLFRPVHIPAWKKLGLKLKYAKDDAEVVVTHIPPTNSQRQKNQKRRRTAEDSSETEGREGQVRAAKKSKTSSSSKSASSLSESSHHNPPTVFEPPSSPIAQASQASTKKRRSVVFTPETKQEDGGSIKQLYNAWLASQKADNVTIPAGETYNALKAKDQGTAADRKAKKKAQKTKKPLGHLQTSTDSTSEEPKTHPALVYLDQYHHSRGHWKFNKAKQSYLLKHLLDIDRIPPRYDEALVDYLRHLQSEAARTRVKEAMYAYKTQDVAELMEVDEPTRKERRQQYEDALAFFVGRLKNQQGTDIFNEGCSTAIYKTDDERARKLQRRLRAEAILWALSRGESIPPQAYDVDEEEEEQTDKRIKLTTDGSFSSSSIALSQASTTTTTTLKTPTARKHKLRTNAVDDDSDEEDDDDEEDEDEPESSDDTGSSVSSSSSSSSDDSEDDDDDDDEEGNGADHEETKKKGKNSPTE